MNAKVIAVFCLLGGLLCGFKLGYQAGQGSGIIPVTETAPAKVRPRESVLSRPAADRSTLRAASVNQIAERVRRALGNSGSDLRFAGIIAALMGVTSDQIPVLAELLRKEINGRSGYIVTYALMPMWAEQDPAASLAFALSLDNSNRRRTVPGVLAGWARNNLAAALAHVQSQPKGSMRSEIARAILSEMATIDPQGAIAFIKQEGINSHSSNGTLASVFSNWVGKDPAFAAAAALELSSSKDRSCAIRSVVDAWARQDPNAAYHFVQSLSNVTEQAMAIITAIGSMVGNDPHRHDGVDKRPCLPMPIGSESTADCPAFGSILISPSLPRRRWVSTICPSRARLPSSPLSHASGAAMMLMPPSTG